MGVYVGGVNLPGIPSPLPIFFLSVFFPTSSTSGSCGIRCVIVLGGLDPGAFQCLFVNIQGLAAFGNQRRGPDSSTAGGGCVQTGVRHSDEAEMGLREVE